MTEKQYIAIDLKSFYASVECRDRGLDPLTTNLVVADESRTEKTICLAVSPSLKSYGIPGRARLFEVIEKVKEVNIGRTRTAPGRKLTGSSVYTDELTKDPSLAVDYVIAVPRMGRYMEVSTKIYQIYLKYIAPEDIHVYSIDEVFMDVTAYLGTYKMTAKELASRMISEVLESTGITATAGIGSNLYLCKIAMDIEAKHIPADRNGVRIAQLTEQSYREKLWDHRPITDFWRVGRGYAEKLEKYGIFTMGDVALCSVQDPELLFRLFGINAELLIDHAWGWEPCTIAEIKNFKPETNSVSSGQVLSHPYPADKGRLIACEMADLLSLDLVEKRLVTDQMVLTVCYDIKNLEKGSSYSGEVSTDRYGRKVPKDAHGSINLPGPTSSSAQIIRAISELYDRIVAPELFVRKLYVIANNVVREDQIKPREEPVQLDLFTDYAALEKKQEEEEARRLKERSMQEAMLEIKKKFGKNAILRGMNLEEGATARERNAQIGGHRE